MQDNNISSHVTLFLMGWDISDCLWIKRDQMPLHFYLLEGAII